jgi:very-short-patch-repair endonuclease
MAIWAGIVSRGATDHAHFPSAGLAAPRKGVELCSLDSFAADHHGLITLAAAVSRGISRATWYRALESGVLEPLYPGVARMYGAPASREQAIAAAVLAAGKGAMASHRSAAHRWGIPRPDDDPIDVMLTERRREANLPGVLVHRPRDRRDLSPVLRRNIRTSNILRLLCDLGAVDSASIVDAVGHVVTNGLASPVALRTAVEVHARRGRHGVPAFRNALEEWVIDGKPVDSVLEPAMRKLVHAYNLPPVEFHPIVGGYEVDFLVVGTNIILECDGWETHGRNRRRFEMDRSRDADLIALGNVVVRFTYRAITRRAAKEAERIRAIVRQWAPHLELGGNRRSS